VREGIMKKFGDAFKKLDEEEQQEHTRRPVLNERFSVLEQINSGKMLNKSQYYIDPKLCRMWEHHNRAYDELNEHVCEDLIENIIAKGGQEFPAIVRKTGDEEFPFEVICGARRHWTISYLRDVKNYDMLYLVEVRDLSDIDAFTLSDLENRSRKDISDYERALDYSNALANFYSNQEEMASRLRVKPDWLSRFLDLADLPAEVVSAFQSKTDITVGLSRTLKPLLKDPTSKKKILNEASKIKAERAKEGGEAIDKKLVVRRLVNSTKKAGPKPKTKIIKGQRGRTLVKFKETAKTLSLEIPLSEEMDNEKLIGAFTEYIKNR